MTEGAKTTEATTFMSFACRLSAELDELAARYDSLLTRSRIRNVDPNREASGIVFIAASKWGWVPDSGLVAERTALLKD
jgi:hypothetical protein